MSTISSLDKCEEEMLDSRLPKKKPFLKRLMSCLVLRTRASQRVSAEEQVSRASVNHSYSSYNISTSFAVSTRILDCD